MSSGSAMGGAKITTRRRWNLRLSPASDLPEELTPTNRRGENPLLFVISSASWQATLACRDVYGTELPIRDVRVFVAIGVKQTLTKPHSTNSDL